MVPKVFALLLLTTAFFTRASAQDPLDQYVERLRRSQATGGSETGFLSVGSTFLYGQGYFEKKEYDLAAMYFQQAYQKDSTNAFVNYQVAASLLRQNNKYKTAEAETYWQNAVRLNPGLKARLTKEFPALFATEATEKNQKQPPAGLNAYIEALRYSKATGGERTAMNTAGREVLYAFEYYEQGDYDMAALRLRQAVAKDPNDTYAAYLLAVSLMAQDQVGEGSKFLATAIKGDQSLAQTADADIAAARAKYQQKQKAKQPTTTQNKTNTIKGGKLVLGTYVCTHTVWRGAGVNGGFAPPEQKGSFTLLANGTYRWLDNGGTGRYRYDAATGNITWLSGPLADKQVKSSGFQPGKNIAQITLNFSEDYRWECGCKK
ncbi:MAG: tetratricopeptide repeat protein [Flavisolibacter sp.]